MNSANSDILENTPRDTHAEHVHVPMKTYWVVFAALMVLLFVTVAAAFIDFGHHTINIAIALLIAMTKAALVVLYFMHVKYASRMTQIFVASAFLWLGILFVFTFQDFWTRHMLPVSAGWNENPVLKLERSAEHASEGKASPATRKADH